VVSLSNQADLSLKISNLFFDFVQDGELVEPVYAVFVCALAEAIRSTKKKQIMQNKPNFQNAKNVLTLVDTRNYNKL
jgi:hypothetical protein